MNVLLLNFSPHEFGCTYTALQEVALELQRQGLETEILYAGNGPVHSCTGCKSCKKTGRCVHDDLVNVILDKAAKADGFVFGSPVHYAAPSGTASALLGRVFSAGSALLRHKPGAAVVSCRRAGSTAALDVLNKYFTINQMPVVSSRYWNMVHGNTPEEVQQDIEGLQIMRTLGRNMAWMLKCIDAGKQAGIPPPPVETGIQYNYVR